MRILEITLENYEEKRNELIAENSNLTGLVMRENEKRLAEVLEKLKEEYRESCGGKIPYGMPVLTDKNLTSSRLYGFCSKMPKGADLHVHDMSLLPAKELVKLLLTKEEFFINADRKSYDLKVSKTDIPGYMKFCDAVNTGYYTEAEIIENWTVAGAEKSKLGIWDYFEQLFERHAVLSSNPTFAAEYYDYTFRYYCKKNIQHVEIHLMLTDSIDESADYLKTVRQAYYNVKKDYPYFTLKIIGAGVKADSDNIDLTKKCFLNTSYVKEIIKDESDSENPTDLVVGFDLVNEEDTSLPLHKFAPMLLKVKKQYPDMKLYIHGGESLEATNENLIDAYLLGVSRVGHGLNLYRYPDLHKRYVDAEICLEVCPISNQTLGYTKDIRNHPATEYLRSGAALALCSDDPAYMENETLTDDFFAAVVGWNLGLSDIKQLAINSIVYSAMTVKEKTKALKAYNALWNKFIDEILTEYEN